GDGVGYQRIRRGVAADQVVEGTVDQDAVARVAEGRGNAAVGADLVALDGVIVAARHEENAVDLERDVAHGSAVQNLVHGSSSVAAHRIVEAALDAHATLGVVPNQV